MNLFLATIKVNRSEYMDDDSKTYVTHRIVQANDLDEARQKVYDFYTSRSTDYGTNYTVYDCTITEAIV